jgi:hypothetical protein
MTVRSPNPGIAPTNVGVPSGQVLADDGKLYSSVQDAENAANNCIIIGPGTFDGNVSVDTPDISIFGSGDVTLIREDTQGDSCFTVTSANVNISNMSLNSSGGFRGVDNSGSSIIVSNITVIDSGQIAFYDSGGDGIFYNTVMEGGHSHFFIDSARTIVTGNMSKSNINNNSTQIRADDVVFGSNIINGVGAEGIKVTISRNDNIGISNRINNVGTDGIYNEAEDNIYANNRISDSSGSDINDTGTGTVLDGNLTGASN